MLFQAYHKIQWSDPEGLPPDPQKIMYIWPNPEHRYVAWGGGEDAIEERRWKAEVDVMTLGLTILSAGLLVQFPLDDPFPQLRGRYQLVL